MTYWENLKLLTSSLPSAKSRAVSSSRFLIILSAPAWHRRLAIDASCLPTAKCRAVHPLNMAASTLAPLFSRRVTADTSWSSTAICSADFPLVPSWKTSRRVQTSRWFARRQPDLDERLTCMFRSTPFFMRSLMRRWCLCRVATWRQARPSKQRHHIRFNVS